MVKKAKSKSAENGKARTSNEAKEEDNNNSESSYLNECKKTFGSTDLYSILSLNKSDATQSDSKLLINFSTFFCIPKIFIFIIL